MFKKLAVTLFFLASLAKPLLLELPADGVTSNPGNKWINPENTFVADSQYSFCDKDNKELRVSLRDPTPAETTNQIITNVRICALNNISGFVDDSLLMKGYIPGTPPWQGIEKSFLGDSVPNIIEYDITGQKSWTWQDIFGLETQIKSLATGNVDSLWKADYLYAKISTSVGTEEKKGLEKILYNFKTGVNPSKKIELDYTLKSNAQVNLSIYSLLGVKVGEIVNENQSPGDYNYKFEPEHNGHYFSVLRVNNKNHVRKSTILK